MQADCDAAPAMPGVTRAAAARHLLARPQFRESVYVAPQPWVRLGLVAGAQAAMTTAIALPFFLFSSWAHLIGFASLGALAALFARFAPRAERGGIVLRCGFWLTFAVAGMSAAMWLGMPTALHMPLLALAAGLFFYVSTSGGFGPPGALIFVFAASAAMRVPSGFDDVMARTVATASVALLAWLICRVSDRWRIGGDESALPVEPAHPIGRRLTATARIVAGSAVAGLIAQASGAAHPGWAAMGAVAVLQGAHLNITMNRAVQRMVGTVLGALLAWLVLVQAPSALAVIGLLIALILATEVVIGSNYGLGQILVTPMALLMTYLASPQSGGVAMVPERIGDTLVGVVVAAIFAVITSSFDERIRLADHHARRTGQTAL